MLLLFSLSDVIPRVWFVCVSFCSEGGLHPAQALAHHCLAVVVQYSVLDTVGAAFVLEWLPLLVCFHSELVR